MSYDLSRYYGKLDEYSVCRSEIRDASVTWKNLGITNWTWSSESLEFVVNEPRSLAGKTVSEVANGVEWTIEKRNLLQADHREVAQVNSCDKWSAPVLREDRMVRLPNIRREYVRKSWSCGGSDGGSTTEERLHATRKKNG